MAPPEEMFQAAMELAKEMGAEGEVGGLWRVEA